MSEIDVTGRETVEYLRPQAVAWQHDVLTVSSLITGFDLHKGSVRDKDL